MSQLQPITRTLAALVAVGLITGAAAGQEAQQDQLQQRQQQDPAQQEQVQQPEQQEAQVESFEGLLVDLSEYVAEQEGAPGQVQPPQPGQQPQPPEAQPDQQPEQPDQPDVQREPAEPGAQERPDQPGAEIQQEEEEGGLFEQQDQAEEEPGAQVGQQQEQPDQIQQPEGVADAQQAEQGPLGLRVTDESLFSRIRPGTQYRTFLLIFDDPQAQQEARRMIGEEVTVRGRMHLVQGLQVIAVQEIATPQAERQPGQQEQDEGIDIQEGSIGGAGQNR